MKFGRASFAALAVAALAGGALPTEFRIFVAGWNDTEKGRFLFDAEAAAATMAAYEDWGIDLMIDLEHQSLDPETPPDPTARDARGWCRLELREGSLWAVNVTWTADGAARLNEKRQRYISPAFDYDPETKRVVKIVNIAITAIPATHDTPALVAARAERGPRDGRTRGRLAAGPSFSDVSNAICGALQTRFPSTPTSCGPWVLDIFDASVVYELDGKLYEVAYTFDGAVATLGASPVEVKRTYAPAAQAPAAAPPAPAPAPAAPPAPATNSNRNRPVKKLAAAGEQTMAMDPKLIAAAIEALQKGDAKALEQVVKDMLAGAANDSGPAPAGGADDQAAAAAAAAADDETDPKKKDPMAAAARFAMALTGETDPGRAMTELARRSKIAVDVESREKTLAADRAVIEASERRTLVGELVKLGAEIPATAWGDEKGTVPCDRLAREPIAELRSRVEKLSAAAGARRGGLVPPVRVEDAGNDGAGVAGSQEFTTPHGVVTLSARELRTCKEVGAKPEEYAANKAAQARARGGARA